jgi:hypothetical protein
MRLKKQPKSSARRAKALGFLRSLGPLATSALATAEAVCAEPSRESVRAATQLVGGLTTETVARTARINQLARKLDQLRELADPAADRTDASRTGHG